MAPYGGKGLPAALKQINIFGYEPVTTVCQTGEFVVYRAQSLDLGKSCSRFRLPPGPPPRRSRHLEHELETGRELDPAFAVKPLRIERDAGNIALLLEDFAARALSSDLTAAMDLDRFFRIATATAEALAALHRQGVVHKDIKPENIFLSGGGPDGAIQVKLTGFGVASKRSHGRQAPGRARGNRRNARLHGARTDGAHEPRHRLAQRPLRAGRHLLPDADRTPAVHRVRCHGMGPLPHRA